MVQRNAISGAQAARRRRAGLALVELLVAGVILSVSLAAIVSMFHFGFTVTQRNDDKSVAYNVARLELESIRFEGFANALIVRNDDGTVFSKFRDGTRVTYYNSAGTRLANSTGAAYSATLVVTSDELVTLSNGTQRPADDALRTVTVTVRRYPSNEVVHTDGTFLARSGV